MDPGKALLHLGPDCAQFLLHAQAAFHQRLREPADRKEQDHERHQRDEREAPLHGEHEGQRIDVDERGVGEGQHTHPDHHPHRAQIVDHPRHQVAGLQPLVKGTVEPREMGEEIVAQAVFDVAPAVEEHEARAPSHRAHRQRRSDDFAGEPSETAGIVGLDRVDRLAGQIRQHHPQRHGAERAEYRERVAMPVRTDVAEKAFHVSRLIYQAPRRGPTRFSFAAVVEDALVRVSCGVSCKASCKPS